MAKMLKRKNVSAIQMAFELEQKIAKNIRIAAAGEGITSSDEIRKRLGLSYSLPQRPRLTLSLTPEDYKTLGKRFKIDANDPLEIKRRIIKQLVDITVEP